MRLCFLPDTLLSALIGWAECSHTSLSISIYTRHFVNDDLRYEACVLLVCICLSVCARVCARWYGDCVCLLCDWCSCHLLLLGSTMTHSFSFSLFLSLPSFFRSSVRLLSTLHWNWLFYIENYILDEFKRKKEDYKTCLATFWHYTH